MLHKRGFTIIEVVVVFSLILAVTFMIVPKSLDSTKQAKFISKWSQTYSDFEYICSVIRAQKESRIEDKVKNAEDKDKKQEIVLDAIRPYIRIKNEIGGNYSQKFMNGMSIDKSSRYYVDKFYDSDNGNLVGLKWLQDECLDKDSCALIVVDVNGVTPPNRWGKDVFGINILKDGVEPVGKGLLPQVLRKDCSAKGFGTYCSYYYLMGGRFD